MFSNLWRLPVEIRHTVYSMMELPERAQMARSSRDALEYLQHHKLKAKKVSLCVETEDGNPSLNLNIDNLYEEKHLLSGEIVEELRAELDSYLDCECIWCTKKQSWNSLTDCARIVRRINWKSVDDLFLTMKLVLVRIMSIKTEPYGGLVDCLQPSMEINRWNVISFSWHEKKRNIRPNLNLPKWRSWLGARQVHFRTPHKNTTIDKELFNCEEMRNAEIINPDGPIDLDLGQILQLRARELTYYLPANGLQIRDFKEYFKRKLMEWLAHPVSYVISFKAAVLDPRVPENPLEHTCVVELCEELLDGEIEIGPHVSVRRNWDMWQRCPGHNISIIHRQHKALLLVTNRGFLSLPTGPV